MLFHPTLCLKSYLKFPNGLPLQWASFERMNLVSSQHKSLWFLFPQFCSVFRAFVAPPGTSRATCPRRGSGSPMPARGWSLCLPLWSRLLLPLRQAWRSGGWGSVPLWSALLQERVSLHRKWDRWNQSGCLIRLLSATKSELSRASDPSSENGIRLEPVLGRSARLG